MKQLARDGEGKADGRCWREEGGGRREEGGGREGGRRDEGRGREGDGGGASWGQRGGPAQGWWWRWTRAAYKGRWLLPMPPPSPPTFSSFCAIPSSSLSLFFLFALLFARPPLAFDRRGSGMQAECNLSRPNARSLQSTSHRPPAARCALGLRNLYSYGAPTRRAGGRLDMAMAQKCAWSRVAASRVRPMRPRLLSFLLRLLLPPLLLV
ncbi:hypothetical protein BDZ91DRAFT_830225 [Kalaharituber pfeilii]|nr:hypothetical protein BDZ91DRAFT_830225 [Kalaharituber pfeilii]